MCLKQPTPEEIQRSKNMQLLKRDFMDEYDGTVGMIEGGDGVAVEISLVAPADSYIEQEQQKFGIAKDEEALVVFYWHSDEPATESFPKNYHGRRIIYVRAYDPPFDGP